MRKSLGLQRTAILRNDREIVEKLRISETGVMKNIGPGRLSECKWSEEFDNNDSLSGT